MYDLEYFKWPVLSEKAIARVNQLLREGNISRDSSLCRELEETLAGCFGVKHVLPVNNGTAAAFSAFTALGLGPGDEIIAPPYSHWATVLPAKVLGCKIRFTDVETDSFNPDPDEIKKAISPATKAIVVCHLYGNPVDIISIRKLCHERHLFLLEDVSHAVGASIGQRRVGSFGDIAFFSMQASKVLTAGEGGCLITDDYDYYARAVELGHPKRIKELKGPWQKYKDTGKGYKFRLSSIHTAIALESFKTLEDQHSIRNAMCRRLKEALSTEPGIHFAREVKDSKRVYWEQELFLKKGWGNTTGVRQGLLKRKVNAYEPNFRLIPDLPHFRHSQNQSHPLPGIRSLVERMIILPAFKKINTGLVDFYAKVFKEVLSQYE
jgi:dTDP-4-amino-4,6-dideoxygalactose transaminase